MRNIFKRRTQDTAGVQCSTITRKMMSVFSRILEVPDNYNQHDWTRLSSKIEDCEREAPEVSTHTTDALDIPHHGDNDHDFHDTDSVNSYLSQRKDALPKTTGRFGSNHVLINKERVKRDVMPLKRDQALDEIALSHAKAMAEQENLFHSNADVTITETWKKSGPCRLIGENVTKQGKGTKYLTRRAMAVLFANSGSDRKNILDPRFQYLGIGTQMSVNGTLYICQLFKG